MIRYDLNLINKLRINNKLIIKSFDDLTVGLIRHNILLLKLCLPVILENDFRRVVDELNIFGESIVQIFIKSNSFFLGNAVFVFLLNIRVPIQARR